MDSNTRSDHKDTLDHLCKKAEKFYSLGKVAEAEEILIYALEIDPCHDRTHSNLGVINWERHHREAALEHFAKAYSINPYCSKTASKFISSLLEMNKYSLASVIFSKSKEILTDQADLQRHLGKTIAENDFAGLKIDTIDVHHLHQALNFKEELHYPISSFIKDLSKWRMEIDDAPIFRYLYRNFRPRRHLEFGTWQGAGTVYCLEECDATVWTINLPFGEMNRNGAPAYKSGDSFDLRAASKDAWASRLGLATDWPINTDSIGFIGRFYLERGLGNRVCQIYADSTTWDISSYPPSFFDSVLIDGGHSAETVESDTRKALALARSGALVMWHDFCPSVRNRFEVVQGVMAGINRCADIIHEQFATLFWIEPSWILVGIKK